MKEPDAPLIVFSTAPQAHAGALARRLVEERLAACVQRIQGVRSTYFWDGAVQDDEEVLMVIKTRAGRFEALRDALSAWHPYDVPEIVAVDVVAGADPYLRWLDRQTRPSSG